MENKNKPVGTKLWKVSLCVPQLKNSLIDVLGNELRIKDWFKENVEVIKSDAYSQVGFFDSDVFGRIYIKRYQAKFWWHRLAMLFRCGRAVRSFKVSLQLSARGLPVPQPYAVLTETGTMGLPDSCYYLCQGLVDGEDLKSFHLRFHQSNRDIINDRLQQIGSNLKNSQILKKYAGISYLPLFAQPIHSGQIGVRC